MWAFHTALYENQPAEGTDGLSDQVIAEIATDAGVPAGVADAFTDGVHRGWVVQSTRDANDAGVSRTPTVLVNGEAFAGDWSTPGKLAEAIEHAASDGQD